MKVKVGFPDGVKEIPAYYASDCLAQERSQMKMSVLTPEGLAGWEFRRVIGKPEWIAFKVSE
jgi:hypothetical protein